MLKMNKKYFNNSFETAMKSAGWNKIDAGGTKTIDYNASRAVYVREISAAEIIENSANTKSKNPAISTLSAADTNNSRDIVGDVYVCDTVYTDNLLPCFSATGSFGSDFSILEDLKSDENNLIIRADSCWVGNPSKVISYNFSVYSNGIFYNFLFFPFSNVLKTLTINYMIGRVFDYIGIARYDRRNCIFYEYIPKLDDKGRPYQVITDSYKEAKSNGIYAYIKDKPTAIKLKDVDKTQKNFAKAVHKCVDYKRIRHTNITLLVYQGLRFFSSTDIDASYGHDFLHSGLLKGTANGIFTIQPHYFACNSTVNSGWNYMYAIKADVRDINLHSVYDEYGIWQLAAGVKYNVDKYKGLIEKQFEHQLPELLTENPQAYADYALGRNMIPLLYIAKMYGMNKHIPCTLLSGLDKTVAKKISAALNCKSELEFLAYYSGTTKYRGSARDVVNEKFGRIGKLSPLNDDCNEIQQYASKAYRGGYIGCDNIAVHHGDTETYDYDLISAYTIGMAMAYDINWDDPIYDRLTPNKALEWDDFEVDGTITPMAPIFAKVKYEFDDNYPYPCLPYGKENSKGLIDSEFYPRKNNDGVYCCGPELFLAMKMGAKITVINGIVADVRHKADGTISQSLQPIVAEYVQQRAKAAEIFGKDSMEAKTLKKLVNSIYGKTSQNVHDMYGLSDDNEEAVESLITNNVAAALITSLVRATIFAALNQVNFLTYTVYSATTDGLITDMPYDEFDELDLMGLKPYLLEARRKITGEENPKLWALKHQQNDLLNLASTCNGSMNVGGDEKMAGVIAHSGFSTNAPKKSIEGRKEFFVAAATRTGAVKVPCEQYPTLKQIKNGAIFTPETKERACNFNYDFKRKPLKETLSAENIEIDGNTYEIATFLTAPYEDIDEYLLYNSVQKSFKCLRRVEEWRLFFKAVELKAAGCTEKPHIADYDFRFLSDVIKGYKSGLWSIPYLDNPSLSVAQKCNWINTFNTSDREYTAKDWSRASEKKRWKSILPYAVLKDIVETMGGKFIDSKDINIEDKNCSKSDSDISFIYDYEENNPLIDCDDISDEELYADSIVYEPDPDDWC